MKAPRTFAQLMTDPRVQDYSDERPTEGIWLYLAPGWVDSDHAMTSIHENTIAECSYALSHCTYDPDSWADMMRPYGQDSRVNDSLLPAG